MQNDNFINERRVTLFLIFWLMTNTLTTCC